MSATKSLHYELCVKAGTWIRQRKNAEPMSSAYRWSAVELNCINRECPDVWATNGTHSTIIEVKTSHDDFVNDQNKFCRKNSEFALGDYRYYLCPKGVINIDELPDGWGLIEFDGKRLKKVRQSKCFENANKVGDIRILTSILAREGLVNKTFNYRLRSAMYPYWYREEHVDGDVRNEYLKCKEDFNYFVECYCKFLDKKASNAQIID